MERRLTLRNEADGESFQAAHSVVRLHTPPRREAVEGLEQHGHVTMSLSLADPRSFAFQLEKLAALTMVSPLPQWRGAGVAQVGNWGPYAIQLAADQLHETDQVRLTLSCEKDLDDNDETRTALYRILLTLHEQLQPDEAVPQRPRRVNSTFDRDLPESSDLEEKIDTPPLLARTRHSHVTKRCESAPVYDSAEASPLDELPPPRARSNTVRYLLSSNEGWGGIAFEGYLNKKGDLLAAWKSCYCVLEGKTLAIYDTREDFIADVGLKVRMLLVAVDEEGNGKPNGFCIRTEGHKTQHMASRTAFERDQWIRAIKIQLLHHNSSDGPKTPSTPHVAFASQPIDVPVFYTLLSSLLREEIADFPILCRNIHPDMLLTSNYPPIVPFWGQYRRYDGLLLFISALLETVEVESFEMADIVELFPESTESSITDIDHDIPYKKRLVVTGKETFLIKNVEPERRITQLFVHELWLDYKDRLVRWHINGDSVVLSVAFDACDKGKGLRLMLPGEQSAIQKAIPPGTFYVQVLKAQSLGLQESAEGKSSGVYVRCVVVEGTHVERTFDGLDSSEATSSKDDLAKKQPTKATRFLRGIQRATGTSIERPYSSYGDKSGCVTAIATHKPKKDVEWNSNLRITFPGCPRGSQYVLKIEIYQSRFMMQDTLIGVCKVNLSPHMALTTASAEAKANGALPRWYNLCDIYHDCKEWWAPPTVFRGRLQLAIVYAASHVNGTTMVTSPVESNATTDTTETLREYFSTQETKNNLVSPNPEQQNLFGLGMPSLIRFSSNPHAPIDTERDNHIVMAKKTSFDMPKRYQLIKVLGSGSYGEVIAASDTETGASVAIKKIPQAFRELLDTKRILRELCLLRQLKHPHLIRLWDVLRPTRCCEMEDIYLVTDLMEADLHRIIHSTQTLSDEHVAYLMYQIFRALKYLHSANIVHRDLKPSNVLLTTQCEVKLCDLGLARSLGTEVQDTHTDLTEYVVTRWYRPPEVLLDGSRYGVSVDLWSAGCILAEMLGRKPLFPGSSTITQLGKIFNVLGTPKQSYIDKMIKPAAKKWVQRQRPRPPIPFSELYPQTNELALDLLSKLLTLDPEERITASAALNHPYITSLGLVADDAIDTFTGTIDASHENVPEVKKAMQEAIFEQVCIFHPEALHAEKLLGERDVQVKIRNERIGRVWYYLKRRMSSSKIKTHRRQIPDWERKFMCPHPLCGKRFTRKFSMTEHIKTHTGDKPHECSCGKKFTTAGNLARHRKIHDGQKAEVVSPASVKSNNDDDFHPPMDKSKLAVRRFSVPTTSADYYTQYKPAHSALLFADANTILQNKIDATRHFEGGGMTTQEKPIFFEPYTQPTTMNMWMEQNTNSMMYKPMHHTRSQSLSHQQLSAQLQQLHCGAPFNNSTQSTVMGKMYTNDCPDTTYGTNIDTLLQDPDDMEGIKEEDLENNQKSTDDFPNPIPFTTAPFQTKPNMLAAPAAEGYTSTYSLSNDVLDFDETAMIDILFADKPEETTPEPNVFNPFQAPVHDQNQYHIANAAPLYPMHPEWSNQAVIKADPYTEYANYCST